MLGDLNADGRYFDTADRAHPLRAPAWRWVVPDDADTTVAASRHAYDRIVFLAAATDEDFTGAWGVRRFDADPGFAALGLRARDVSDHWPVWARFFEDRDTR